jgi:hypothetical protein
MVKKGAAAQWSWHPQAVGPRDILPASPYRRQEEIDDQVRQAAGDLCRTVPTTAAGLIALLQYVEKRRDEILMVFEEEGEVAPALPGHPYSPSG